MKRERRTDQRSSAGFRVREELNNFRLFLRRVIQLAVTVRNLRELLVGAVLFHGCQALFEFLVLRPDSRAGIPTRVFFLGFTFVPPILFCLLTVWLYRWSRRHPYTVWPEVNLIVGSIIFTPIYLVFASPLLYGNPPMQLTELFEFLAVSYGFPLTIFSIMVYTFSITPFMLIIISTTLTGLLIRRRSRHHSRRLPSPFSPPGSESPTAVT